ncbi:MAG: chromosomal replication initiator protein DnaA [Chlamydiae bacterium]|nr:chromosomal replication initiator protein DnaA [Chlamydiota bacterium]MBI3277774.1 chromosomal replication initiator protein DnaA [Chlamydiota bacterium]
MTQKTSLDLLEVWPQFVEKAKDTLSPQNYDNWFSPIKPIKINAGTLEIEVPNKFFKDWLMNNYLKYIEGAFADLTGEPIALHIKVSLEEPVRSLQPTQTVHLRRSIPPQNAKNLNQNYTFDHFVVGPSNRFAHAASVAVSQSPGKAYNPLFIYGGVGLGKTHLMHAIGHFVLKNQPKERVLYISSEEFTNQFIDSVQSNAMVRFRNKYRSVDILLIDDIHFLSGKEQTQEEFFHTFNSLYDAHKQVVLSNDRPPKEISNLEERLISRFEWGLVTDLQPPDTETRIAILRKKATLSKVELSDDLAFFLASRIKTNIRKLEGALVKVISYASLNKKEPTIALAEEVIQDILGEEKIVSIEGIQKKVAEHYDLRISDMISKKRPQTIAFPRQIAMYLARELTHYSLQEIGEAFGGRDHTTVLHAHKTVEDSVNKDFKIKKTISFLKQKVRE